MFDAYTRKARIAPAVLAMAPAIVLVGTGALDTAAEGSTAALVIGAVGVVLCGLVRDAGRALEPRLWASWGGSPTLRRLRWRDAGDGDAVDRLHARVARATGRPLPTRDEERADPAGADRRYEEVVVALRERTRGEGFELLLNENAEYGFRRNALGLRPFAAGVAIGIGVFVIVMVAMGDGRRYVVAGASTIAALLFWAVVVRPDWVRKAAEIYAERLLASVERLEPF